MKSEKLFCYLWHNLSIPFKCTLEEFWMDDLPAFEHSLALLKHRRNFYGPGVKLDHTWNVTEYAKSANLFKTGGMDKYISKLIGYQGVNGIITLPSDVVVFKINKLLAHPDNPPSASTRFTIDDISRIIQPS